MKSFSVENKYLKLNLFASKKTYDIVRDVNHNTLSKGKKMSNSKSPIFLILVTWVAIAAVYFSVKTPNNTDDQAADPVLQQEFQSISDKLVSLDRRIQTLEANLTKDGAEANTEKLINEEVKTEEKTVEENPAESSTDGSSGETPQINSEEAKDAAKSTEKTGQ